MAKFIMIPPNRKKEKVFTGKVNVVKFKETGEIQIKMECDSRALYPQIILDKDEAETLRLNFLRRII